MRLAAPTDGPGAGSPSAPGPAQAPGGSSDEPGAVGVLLLRGVNVGGARRVPMAELTTLAEAVGLQGVRTYVASGNVVAHAPDGLVTAGAALERALEARFGFEVPVVARSLAAWEGYLVAMPFAEAAQAAANLVMLAVPRERVAQGAHEVLRARSGTDEAVGAAGDAFWIRYGGGAGRSRIAPGALDRLLGVPTTTRNLRTCRALLGLMQELRAAPRDGSDA